MMFDASDLPNDGRNHMFTVCSADGKITRYLDGWKLDDTTGATAVATEENGG